MAQIQSVTPKKIIAENVELAIPATGNTTLLETVVDNVSFMGLSVKNTGAQDFDAFIVQARMTPDDDYQTILSAAADYTSPAGIVVDASGDLTILAAAASGWLLINTLAFYSIKVLASANVAGATEATIRAIARF